MDSKDSSAEKLVYFLKNTDFIQISFLPMPEESKVLSGEAICTFNSKVQKKINIPPQDIKQRLIFIRNLTEIFSEFKK